MNEATNTDQRLTALETKVEELIDIHYEKERNKDFALVLAALVVICSITFLVSGGTG